MQIVLPSSGQPHVLIIADQVASLASVDHKQIAALYREHGAILMRGFSTDLAAFERFASDFCPVAVRNDSRNRVALGGSGAIQSVNLGVQPFPLHPELSREPWKPDTCFFYCLVPPSAGGSTTLCDGAEIVRQLPTELVEAMAGRRIRYLAPAGPAVLQYWLGTTQPDPDRLAKPPASCPYDFVWVGDQLARSFTRPLLHRTMFGGELAFGNFLLFARYLRGIRNFPLLEDGSVVPDAWVEAVKAVSDRLTVPVDWREGDLLMLDNSRFMHGRTAVTDPDARRIATYFGYWDGAIPDVEEGPDPVWRRPGFVPPEMGAAQAH